MNTYKLNFEGNCVTVFLDNVFSIDLVIYCDDEVYLNINYKFDNMFFNGCTLYLNKKYCFTNIDNFISNVKKIVEKTKCNFKFNDFRGEV